MIKPNNNLPVDEDSIDYKLNKILNYSKGLVCTEFEKVCPSDASFNRIKKEMHQVFDNLKEEIIKLM